MTPAAVIIAGHDAGDRMTSVAGLLRRLMGYVLAAFGMVRQTETSDSAAGSTAVPAGHSDAALRERLAIAETELAAKTRLIALTSHELRTPLNGILGMADLLSRTSLTPEQASYVEAVTTSASSLLALVDDMLDAGRIAAGRWSPRLQPVAVEALIEEVIELLAPRAQGKGLELAAHVAAQVPETVSADPDQIIRILMNLIGNAIKFTQRGGVVIDVSVEAQTPLTATLAMRVRDSGDGISAEHRSRIFGEYERADTGVAAKQAGTGLGLAISRTIARAMSGDVILEHSSAEGSVFCLRVAVPVIRSSASAGHPFSRRRVLLVSDRSIEPPVLMRRLFDLGASVELAQTAQAARDILESGRTIDTILFDQSGGLDVVDFKASLDVPAPPIAVMLAPADRHALDRIRESGIRAHLIKPMRTKSLTKVMSKLLSGRELSPGSIPVASRPEPSMSAPADLKILLADDNDINILLGQSLLRSVGQTCEVANDGALAVTRATEAVRFGHPYDVILMDLHMPELDGFAAISAIREAEQPQPAGSLIVALTADSSEATARQAIAAGADLAMVKPIHREDLLHVLDRARTTRPASRMRASA